MIQSRAAYTYEIDDVKEAVREILDQLQPLTLHARMVGVLACAYDYVESGVVAGLGAALPFPLVGATTISQAVQGEAGRLMLTLMVLYADDCSFAVGVADAAPEPDDLRPALERSYRETAARLNGRERLIVAFPPLFSPHTGDSYVNILSELSGRVPVFGSICADSEPETYAYARTLLGSQAYDDRMTYLLIAGNLEPEFLMASLSKESRLPYRGEITASLGTVLQGINGVSVVDYMETIGLASQGKLRPGINSIPFLLNFDNPAGQDDVAVARALFMITPENYAVCGGEMPVGASITVGVCDKADVLSTTRWVIGEINRLAPGRTVLIHSCVGRCMALGADPLMETRMAVDGIDAGISFMMSYSSGEICPTSMARRADGNERQATNRYHNFTVVACVL